MGAVTGLSLLTSTPARAEMIDLICHFRDDKFGDLHVSIDLARQSVVTAFEERRSGPFAASISDSLIRWTHGSSGDLEEFRYTIDRVAGTIRLLTLLRGARNEDVQGQCRRTTQKF